MRWPQNSVSISKSRVSKMPEKLISDMRQLSFVVFATILVACNSEARSADNGGQPAASSPDSSVEVLGEIRATLNGKQRTWYVTREYKYGRWFSESNLAFRGEGTVTLAGHVSKDTTTNALDILILEAHLRSTKSGHDVQLAKVTFGGANLWQGRYGSEFGGDVSLEFDTAVHEDAVTRLAGTFSGSLPYKSNASAEPDMGNIVELENGRFDINLVVSN